MVGAEAKMTPGMMVRVVMFWTGLALIAAAVGWFVWRTTP